MKHKLSYSFLHGFGWAVLLVISSIVYTLFEVSKFIGCGKFWKHCILQRLSGQGDRGGGAVSVDSHTLFHDREQVFENSLIQDALRSIPQYFRKKV